MIKTIRSLDLKKNLHSIWLNLIYTMAFYIRFYLCIWRMAMKQFFKYKSKGKDNPNITRITSLILFVSVISVSILLKILTLSHINHVHDHKGLGGSCTVCVQIEVEEVLIKQLQSGLVEKTILVFSLYSLLVFYLKFSDFYVSLSTLVSLKVRLDN